MNGFIRIARFGWQPFGNLASFFTALEIALKLRDFASLSTIILGRCNWNQNPVTYRLSTAQQDKSRRHLLQTFPQFVVKFFSLAWYPTDLGLAADCYAWLGLGGNRLATQFPRPGGVAT